MAIHFLRIRLDYPPRSLTAKAPEIVTETQKERIIWTNQPFFKGDVMLNFRGVVLRIRDFPCIQSYDMGRWDVLTINPILDWEGSGFVGIPIWWLGNSLPWKSACFTISISICLDLLKVVGKKQKNIPNGGSMLIYHGRKSKNHLQFETGSLGFQTPLQKVMPWLKLFSFNGCESTQCDIGTGITKYEISMWFWYTPPKK